MYHFKALREEEEEQQQQQEQEEQEEQQEVKWTVSALQGERIPAGLAV